ncbi:MAG: hypothetical protein US97_C0039G0011 [Microgenomates group bacterium GW2011_GWF1_38_5]|nr:MAG: hypothetical protein US97_C0039G0011 [Microgenomates group bacterium GW2011_GWF1_38_5]
MGRPKCGNFAYWRVFILKVAILLVNYKKMSKHSYSKSGKQKKAKKIHSMVKIHKASKMPH